MNSFFQELKQRRVYRVALAYVIAASATVQVVGTVLPTFHAPNWVQQLFVVVLALGFPVALALAWVFEIAGSGIKKTVVVGSQRTTNHRRLLALAATGLLGAALALAGYWVWHPWRNASKRSAPDLHLPGTPAAPAIPDKSIAVLPFANLSDQKGSAYFTDGVQDEILTDLAKVADLKVISRTSVMQYKSGAERNLREIGQALGVAHILEGSVQRDGGRVRVSAQLIDARTDDHLWADRYDRQLTDLFALESDLAEEIVSQLETKLSPGEKAAIEEPPTSDLLAHDLYSRANNLLAASVFNVQGTDNLFEAARLLQEAVEHDPTFFLAYCRLASAHDQIYIAGADHTPARRALADAALKTALRLRPQAGATHLALAEHLYCGYLDYDSARQELEIARRSLPNEPWVYELAGYIDRRQGRWSDSNRNLALALEFDPRNTYMLQQLGQSYVYQRRFADAATVMDQALRIVPNDNGLRVARASVEVDWHADAQPARMTIEAIMAQDPRAAAGLADQLLSIALYGRDRSAGDLTLGAMPVTGYSSEGFTFPRAWCKALLARAGGDSETARTAFSAARDEAEEMVHDQPDNGESLSLLGMIDAALGRKDDAIREGRRAVELLPTDKDSINGAFAMEYLAVIYAWTGELDSAFAQLKAAAAIPGDVTYGQLRLHPFWDPLRSDPRFGAIVASLAPEPEKL